jgi:hypothetical protein
MQEKFRYLTFYFNVFQMLCLIIESCSAKNHVERFLVCYQKICLTSISTNSLFKGSKTIAIIALLPNLVAIFSEGVFVSFGKVGTTLL